MASLSNTRVIFLAFRWGEEPSPETDKKTENDKTPTSQPSVQKKAESPVISSPRSVVEEKNDSQNEPRTIVPRAIRLDIDLSRPLSPEQQTKQQVSNEQKGKNALDILTNQGFQHPIAFLRLPSLLISEAANTTVLEEASLRCCRHNRKGTDADRLDDQCLPIKSGFPSRTVPSKIQSTICLPR